MKRSEMIKKIKSFHPCYALDDLKENAKHWPSNVTSLWLLKNAKRGEIDVSLEDRLWIGWRIAPVKVREVALDRVIARGARRVVTQLKKFNHEDSANRLSTELRSGSPEDIAACIISMELNATDLSVDSLSRLRNAAVVRKTSGERAHYAMWQIIGMLAPVSEADQRAQMRKAFQDLITAYEKYGKKPRKKR